MKYRALRLDTGNFAWGSESSTHKARILDVVYNASNNELVRTKTLVKGAVIQIDATPFRQWYEQHYNTQLGKKHKETTEDGKEKKDEKAKKSKHVLAKFAARAAGHVIDPLLKEQFNSGRLYAVIASRPGQSGRCDGYILEVRATHKHSHTNTHNQTHTHTHLQCSLILLSSHSRSHLSPFLISFSSLIASPLLSSSTPRPATPR